MPRAESMQDRNASPTFERPAEEAGEPPSNSSWIRAIARPAASIEIGDVDDSACRDDQRVQIACLALAAG